MDKLTTNKDKDPEWLLNNILCAGWFIDLVDFLNEGIYANPKDIEFVPCNANHNMWGDDSITSKPHVVVCVNCNDLFFWACGDDEPIAASEDVELFKKCYEDVHQALKGDSNSLILSEEEIESFHWYTQLYAARKRGMRIQHGYYDNGYLPKKLHDLFNSVAEPRETGFGNPRFKEDSLADTA